MTNCRQKAPKMYFLHLWLLKKEKDNSHLMRAEHWALVTSFAITSPKTQKLFSFLPVFWFASLPSRFSSKIQPFSILWVKTRQIILMRCWFYVCFKLFTENTAWVAWSIQFFLYKSNSVHNCRSTFLISRLFHSSYPAGSEMSPKGK